MATPEALIKYYDCLKDSFSKIQDKDNKTALVNAALRPKIREEFAKDQNVLISYLNYIQVFSVIYSDKFLNICNHIIVPLFKEKDIQRSNNEQVDSNVENELVLKIHDTISVILKSKPELAEDFIVSVVKVFPNQPLGEFNPNDEFFTYLKNSLKACTYLKDKQCLCLIAKILDKLNPPPVAATDERLHEFKRNINHSYEIVYRVLDKLGDDHPSQMIAIGKAIITAFTTDFISNTNQSQLNFLLFYICSLNKDLENLMIELLFSSVFLSTDRPVEERKSGLCFASSFLSRASYVDLAKVLEFLEKTNNWCTEFLDELANNNRTSQGLNDTIDCFHAATQSSLYLITQKYREMYEEESIAKLDKLNLDRILDCQFRPLEICDSTTEQRFQEVATLYNLYKFSNLQSSFSVKKRRKSTDKISSRVDWKVPFSERYNNSMPQRIKPLYREYYDHRNFTIFRE